jgi:cellobiose phosphorylase
MAETVLGHGDRAFDVYRRTAPAYIEDQQLHRTEPYVYSQTVNGKESFKPGEAKNSWLTGTAAWNFYAVSQAILGVKPQLDGLMIDPCLPASLKAVHIRRVFRGTTYEIDITNHSGGEKGSWKSPWTVRASRGRPSRACGNGRRIPGGSHRALSVKYDKTGAAILAGRGPGFGLRC